MERSLILKTARLELRELVAEDLEGVHAFFSDSRVCEHAAFGPCTYGETRAWLEEMILSQLATPRLVYELAILRHGSDEVIGTCHLGIRSQPYREAVLGYTLRQEDWGQGFATEAARAMLSFAFGELGLHRVFATASPLNVASHRVLEKAGMLREGYLRSNVLMRGRWRDSVLFAVINPDELIP